MTVNANLPVSGPSLADGSLTEWPFTFKVMDEAHMALHVSNEDGTDAEIVTGNFSIAPEYINNDAGGYVVYPLSGSPLPVGKVVYAIRMVPYDQPQRIGNQGTYWPETHERTFDLLAMQIQQLAEEAGRSVQIPVTADPAELDELIADIIRLADSVAEIDTVAGIATQVDTVAGISGQVVTVAGIAPAVVVVASIAPAVSATAAVDDEIVALAPITTEIAGVYDIRLSVVAVAAIDGDVVAVAAIGPDVTQVASIAANVVTVAAISSDVTTVAGISGDVTTVAGISGDVTTVAGISGDVTTVAGIAADTTAVAAISEDVETVADNIADVQSAFQNAQDAIAAKNAAEAAAAGVNLPSINPGDAGFYLRVKDDESGHELRSPALVRVDLGLTGIGFFSRADWQAPVLSKTGAGTISVKAGTIIEVAGEIYHYANAEPVSMPTLAAGDDLAVWILPDGTPVATLDHVTPPVSGARKIGGAHYAPGENATGYNTGGNTTPAINEFSLWDLKYRPSCLDARGMTCVAGRFWRDIYHCGVDHHINGTSRYNVTMADGSSPPKVPVMFGGNGSTTYSTFNWWEAAEVMASHGKRLPTYDEFTTGAFGTTEASSGGTDPVSTILRAAYTSKWGIILASGNLYEWGWDFGGDHAAASWANTAGGRGQVYMQSNVALFGGDWDSAANSGSRASFWNYLPSLSLDFVGARGCSDHMNHV